MSPLPARIGAMRESLELQSNTETTSTGTGFRTASWAAYATVPAEKLSASSGGTEQWQQAAVVAEDVHLFRIRYRADVRAKHRAIWRGLTLQILTIPQIVTHVGDRFLVLRCGQVQ